jgi:hypothetical protein
MASLYDSPKILTDAWGHRLSDPTTGTVVGVPAPFGRERIVSAIGPDGGPRLIEPARLVVDAWGFRLCDPTTGTIVGKPALWVQRMLSAGRAHDTRRL